MNVQSLWSSGFDVSRQIYLGISDERVETVAGLKVTLSSPNRNIPLNKFIRFVEHNKEEFLRTKPEETHKTVKSIFWFC